MPNAESERTVPLEQRKAIIRRQACFTDLTDEELQTLADLLREQQAVAGDVIVHESDPIDSVYFIVNGNADVRHVTYQNGEPHIQSVATLKEGDTIGLNDSGFYSVTGRRTATVVADSEMLILRLGLAVFHGFALVNPHVSRVMREHAARMLQMRE